MTRISSRSVEDAPEASRPLLQEMIQFSPTGRLLNMHAQMANAPAVLAGYVSLRRATAQHGTLSQPVRSALMLAAATAAGNEYAQAVISTLALRSGWRKDQVEALLVGKDVGDAKTDSLTSLVREAAAHHGRVSDRAWQQALASGWNDQQLAEAFAYLGLAVFTAYFLNYAATELDIPGHDEQDIPGQEVT
jgi:alkylhydroperoxidase family enzyme